MNEASSRFLSRATRGVRFLCRVMAEHCNGSGHVPGCPKINESSHNTHDKDFPKENNNPKIAKIDLLSLDSAYDAAFQKLKDIANIDFVNKATGLTANVSSSSAKKIVSGNAVGTTLRNLKDTGYCDKDTAYQIHMSAAARISELFINAEIVEQEALYHEADNRDGAWHAYSKFRVPGREGDFVADISIIKFKGDNGKRLYSLGLEIERPR